MRQGTWPTGGEGLNRSSAAVFTTEVNSERVLISGAVNEQACGSHLQEAG